MRIHEVQLVTEDPQGQARFYSDVLGLPARLQAGRAAVQARSSRLVFTRGEPDQPATYHFAFNITESKLEQAHAWLRERVPLVPDEHGEVIDFPAWNAHALYFRDPAGNIVEFIARHALASMDHGAFSPADILGVSEIGLPVADVQPAAAEITAAAGIPRYGRGGPDFQALGDEHGLLILVTAGREWHPRTGQPAGQFETEILADCNAPWRSNEAPYRLTPARPRPASPG